MNVQNPVAAPTFRDVHLDRDSIRIVGGDYGQICIEGNTPFARHALDQIVAATRCGVDRAHVELLVSFDDGATPFIEIRNAGYAGTPGVGVGPGTANADAGGEESVDPEGLGERDAESLA